MTQLAHATESHISPIEKVPYTGKTHTTVAKGRSSMTKLGTSTTICCLLFGVLVLAPGSSWAQNRPPVLEQIAKTYGVDSYGQIEAIRYTWNAEITGLFKAAHVWGWES